MRPFASWRFSQSTRRRIASATHVAASALPPESAFAPSAVELLVHHPAHVGEVLKNPDGGSWMRGQVKQVLGQPAAVAEAS